MRVSRRSVRSGLLLGLLVVGGAHAAEPLRPRLSGLWDRWLADEGLLLTERERSYFDSLETEEMRELFAAAFWRSRGDAVLERWSSNREAAERTRPRSPAGRRAVLLFGKPASIERIEACGGLRPLEIWRWDPWLIERQGGSADETLRLVLVQQNRLLPASFAPWDPSDPEALGYYPTAARDLDAYLDQIRPASCVSADLRGRLAEAAPLDRLREAMPWPRPEASWLDELATLGGDLAPAPGIVFDVDYPGTNGRHTIVRGQLEVPVEQLAELVPGRLFDRVGFIGDVYRRDYLVDSFHVVHHVVGAPPGDVVRLHVFRGLRPGRYRLDLRVVDRRGLALVRARRELDVPRLATPAPPPAGRQRDYGLLTRGEVVLLDTLPSVEVLPTSVGTAAETDLFAITTGGPIARVDFYVDGELVGSDPSPPYAVSRRLTDAPHLLEVVARDGRDRPLASHSRELVPDGRPFAVRLERPAPGGASAPVRLSLPEGTELAKLECFDGRTLTGTAPEPYACPTPRQVVGGLRYVRALATLTNGDTAEHLLFFGPNAPERLDVRLAEVYVSVFDRGGRPATGLTPGDFRVIDGGRERHLVRLESLANLPMSVAVLMDLSSSMGRLARLAAESAERFFENVLIDGDVASLLAFNDDFHRLVPFTGDIDELRLGASGLQALGSTRLYDGIVWALSQFSGQDNRRALVILSDGADVHSDFPFEQVVDAAVEAGVVVYPISIVRSREEPPHSLARLAQRTGGARFVVSSIAELDRAYARIAAELRSQYLLVYELEGGELGLGPRAVDVVVREDLETRNLHGYYP